MNYYRLNDEQLEWRERVADVAGRVIGPRAEGCDREARFPEESLAVLRDMGLWALRVDKAHGGLGGDMVTTCVVVEEISKKCPSTAMCYKMHLESVEAVSRIPTALQLRRFVEPLARGEVFAAAAGGESRGQSGRDWRPVSAPDDPLPRVEGGLRMDNIRKSYVTSAGHASHYIVFCRVEGGRMTGPPDLLMLDADKIDWRVVTEWDGLGMRGNCSAAMVFDGVVPEENLLGIELEGDKEPVMAKYMMPVLILTYGAAYLGIASGAYEIALREAARRFPSGARRIDNPINRRRMAEMSARIEAARALLHTAAAMADDGRAPSLMPYIQAKVVCSELAVWATQELMTMFGGTAFARELPFERYFRDARAGVVMGLANDQAYETIGDILFPPDAAG